jgi:hypothetical protein
MTYPTENIPMRGKLLRETHDCLKGAVVTVVDWSEGAWCVVKRNGWFKHLPKEDVELEV